MRVKVSGQQWLKPLPPKWSRLSEWALPTPRPRTTEELRQGAMGSMLRSLCFPSGKTSSMMLGTYLAFYPVSRGKFHWSLSAQKAVRALPEEILPEAYLLTDDSSPAACKCVLSQLALIWGRRERKLLPMGIFRSSPSRLHWAMLGRWQMALLPFPPPGSPPPC